jgi:formylglycine-generating enzyme required for sulfatase activity
MNHLIRAIAAVLGLAVSLQAAAQGCIGDLTNNGSVDGADLSTVLAYWGPRTQDPSSIASDLDGSGRIDGADLSMLLANWGACPSAIAGISPNQGCTVGGTLVTITGSNLASTSAVSFGNVPAAGFTVVDAGTVRATAPAGALGPAAVRVTTAAGTVTASQPFTYMPPAVTSIVPNVGVAVGGTRVTITGAYLGTTTSVTIGGSPATDLTVVDANTVTVASPSGALGAAEVVVTGAKGTVAIPGAFTYVTVIVPAWATLVEALPDPAIVTDPALRAAIVATEHAWRVRHTATQIEMLLVPPGAFQMGFSAWSTCCLCSGGSEVPIHSVTITRPFYLGRYEVTQAQWTATMGSNPSFFRGYADSPGRPVEQLSWNAIQSFVGVSGLRMPTESEWEYSYRAGTGAAFHSMPGMPGGFSDETLIGNIAWCPGNSAGQTHPVGQRFANALGFHDMAGNVNEWVLDIFANYPADPQTDPVGPTWGNGRVFRGGSWEGPHPCCFRSSYRNASPPTYGDKTLGFRAARDP